jgi:hypothetical protein
MPQLDRYLVFSEIFWFVVLFTLVYLLTYGLLVLLAQGLRLRAALESHHLLEALHLKTERAGLLSLASRAVEYRTLEIPRLERWVHGFRTLLARVPGSQLAGNVQSAKVTAPGSTLPLVAGQLAHLCGGVDEEQANQGSGYLG